MTGVKHVVVMSTDGIVSDITHVLRSVNNHVDYLPITSVQALEALEKPFLAQSRLITFGLHDILPQPLLDRIGFGAVNIHPGPPSYPGWSPHSFALYDGVESYGVTAHFMTNRVDAGAIIGVEMFDIQRPCSTQTMISQVSAAIYRLLSKLASELTQSKHIRVLPITWSTKKTTKAKFRAFCCIPLTITKDELERRVRAFGLGDGISNIHVIAQGRTYLLADNNSHFSIDDDVIILHGVSFKKI